MASEITMETLNYRLEQLETLTDFGNTAAEIKQLMFEISL